MLCLLLCCIRVTVALSLVVVDEFCMATQVSPPKIAVRLVLVLENCGIQQNRAGVLAVTRLLFFVAFG